MREPTHAEMQWEWNGTEVMTEIDEIRSSLRECMIGWFSDLTSEQQEIYRKFEEEIKEDIF